MTRHARLNLGYMLLLPVVAVAAAFLAGMRGVFEPYGATFLTVFGLNAIVMLLAGLFSGLLLLGNSRHVSRTFALAPTVVVAIWGSIAYLYLAVFPDQLAPGAEYLAMPQYLLIGAVVLALLALVFRIVSKMTSKG